MPSLIARNAGLPRGGGASPPDPSTRASAVDPMGALGIPQTPRRSSLIAHSLTSSYAPGTCWCSLSYNYDIFLVIGKIMSKTFNCTYYKCIWCNKYNNIKIIFESHNMWPAMIFSGLWRYRGQIELFAFSLRLHCY